MSIHVNPGYIILVTCHWWESLPLTALDSFLLEAGSLHAYMADSFNDFINSLFICMNPYPGPQSVLVMDNNINSQIWTTSTDMLWSVCISSSINLLAEPHHCMTDLLLHTVFMVTGQQLQGWFRHSGYLICSVPPMKKVFCNCQLKNESTIKTMMMMHWLGVIYWLWLPWR